MYKITSTEERNEKATEYETKSMLYMMNYYDKANEIKWFAIDFFNDVTGINIYQDSCYDIQSKGVKDIAPMLLGRFLVTLFKNYLSDFNFVDYILFVESVSKTIKKEVDSNIFIFNDLSEGIKDSIKEGLIDEANKKSYIEDKTKIIDTNVEDFLSKVSFVIDDKSKEQYIKDAAELSDSVIVDDLYLKKIFKEIRDKQSSKKNNNLEGELLNSIGCFYKYDKYISKEEIQDLIVCRICFNSTFKNLKTVPQSFIRVINGIDETIIEERIEECQNAIFRLLSNKNNKKAYWELFSEISAIIKKNPLYDINAIYAEVDKNKITAVHHLDAVSCKYFISLIKESLK